MPITFVRGWEISKYLLKNGLGREIAVAKKDQENSGSCNMQWESIAGDRDCACTSIVTALENEQRSALNDADHKRMPDRVAKPKAQTSDCAMRLIVGRALREPDREKSRTEGYDIMSDYGWAMARHLDLIKLVPGEAVSTEKKTIGWLRQHLIFLSVKQRLWLRYHLFGLVRLTVQRSIRVYEPSRSGSSVRLYLAPKFHWYGLFLSQRKDKHLVLFSHSAD